MSDVDLGRLESKFRIKKEESQNVSSSSLVWKLGNSDRPSEQPVQRPIEQAADVIHEFDADAEKSEDLSAVQSDLSGAFQVLYKNKDFQMAAKIGLEWLSHSSEIGSEELSQLIDTFKQVGEQAGLETALRIYLDESNLTDSQRFEAQKDLGNTLLRLQDFEGAEECYFKAFRIHSRSDALLVNIGTLEFRKQQFDSARERFVQALDINSENDKAWVGLGLVHLSFGDFTLAIANFERALDIFSANKTAFSMYADTVYKHGSLQKILQRAESYLSECPNDIDVLLTAAKVALILRARDVVNEYSTQILNIDSSHQEARQLLSAIQVGG